ncbi:E3 ubiquitin-protein ligase Mdm2-like isoform X2 [Apostichopus japonicus]|uniref:E3 ubiquitin-protein ligase Mdm2-like isoform X2 n=1 Tax=Stichopus japonicus TaxID=307972 RepID=UPI003AB1E70A
MDADCMPSGSKPVKPKDRFMKLLKSVGAEGPRFTAQEVMSLLIKYISSRRLFDQDDPKKVYCNNDPLGDVFGVSMFTIQDAKRLLFENLIVLPIPGQKPGNPDHNSSCYFTFSHHSVQKPNMQDVHNEQVIGACAIKTKDSSDGVSVVTKPCDAETSRVSSRLIKYGESSKGVAKRNLSSSSSTPSSVKKQKTRRRKRPKPKVRTQKSGEASKPKTQDRQGSSRKAGGRPWYCIVYTSGEDVQSKSSEVLSVQDNETIEAHNSSDDLWFLEDEFAWEFEVVSSSSGTHSQEQSSDDQSQGSEIILDVKVLDSGESRQGDYSSTLDSDEEIPEADKWRCTECNTRNTPLCRYCVRCMAVRSGWLPDEQRMTLWERLHHQGYPVKRTMSAPASNKNLLPPCPYQTKTYATSQRETSHASVNVTGAPRDVSDGRTNRTGPDRTPHQHPLPPQQQHPPTPQQLVTSQSTPNLAGSNLNTLERLQGHESPPPQGGVDEGGVSTNSPDHGPGSQTTLSYPSDSGNTPQSPLKRPWGVARTREDSGLGVSLQAFSSQGTNTLSSSHQPPSSQESPQEPVVKKQRKDPTAADCSHSGIAGQSSRDPLRTQREGDATVTHQSQSKTSHGPSSATKRYEMTTGQKGSSTQDSHHVIKPPPHGPAGPSSSSTVGAKSAPDLCIFCCSRPKTGSIVHGTSGHQVCCYQCAKKLQKRGKPCPACRKPIERIIRNYVL